MDVEQRWNKPEKGKRKDPEETFLNTTFSTTYSTSTRLVLSWAIAGRVSRLRFGGVLKNSFNFSHLLAI
jgi:hypothetical protein